MSFHKVYNLCRAQVALKINQRARFKVMGIMTSWILNDGVLVRTNNLCTALTPVPQCPGQYLRYQHFPSFRDRLLYPWRCLPRENSKLVSPEQMTQTSEGSVSRHAGVWPTQRTKLFLKKIEGEEVNRG
ncbi:uncharacterized protein LACBIDRAFT_325504 [Laccaria bicolor S238N-H82]|uniref:Predicted protein n=1 Tax=Laccaria bicolor (strain S238N-H82 / ATCC MYA-4686) TaxID=486041 RepID=B0D554_LACBS|nr:uncharacterized protein LACBIDRAFT_325504 [Laccaria bicolor S238N-H82]EDR10458.1 predicted protein [Laccaria bicolor S238N-H82]|eukprot:XP_001878908.1 predicted protein [Laccaria bicolor S238N-H82]